METDERSKPSLLAILICEQALLDEDKVASLLRVIDTFNITIEIEEMDKLKADNIGVGVPISCVVFTRWGPGAGEFTEELRIVTPHGDEIKPGKGLPFQKPAGFHFQQVRHYVNLVVQEPGVYFFRVYLDDVLMGEHPFKVNIERRGLSLSRPAT